MARLDESAIWRHLDQLTKPPRSLGQLESLATRLCEIQQTLAPQTMPRRLVVFAGDHGVVDQGVSAWPAEVTTLMVDNIRRGHAASSVLARTTGTPLTLVNVGVAGDVNREVGCNGSRLVDPDVCYIDERVRRGTRDMCEEPALTVDELNEALRIGCLQARRAIKEGCRLLAAGEMGIGNTTSAACLAMLLADLPLDEAVGRGAGADDTILDEKKEAVRFAVDQARFELHHDPMSAIASVAGLEIAAMAGFFLEAAEQNVTIVLDGYVASAAALVADEIEPGVSRSMIAAHLSEEPGHASVLESLGLEPMLDWRMRLGEGTGALLLMPLVDSAAAMVTQMATFSDLGINRLEGDG